MEERKTIAVVTANIVSEYDSEMLEGIAVQAKSLGYNVAVFSLFSLSDELTDHQFGEENIFNLMNFNKIAGVVFRDLTFWTWEMKERIFDFLRKHGDTKVVCVNSNDPKGFANVVQPEKKCFSEIVDHIIEVHGKKKIYCLTGMKDNRNAEERADGYRSSLEAHGIEFREDYVIYGDFWKNSAIALADDIASGKIEKPEAIVCANDIMAISLCEALFKNGMIVPDDIIVSGYDASFDAYENYPSITTIAESNRNIGAVSVCKLHELITGEKTEPAIGVETKLVTGTSCGCGKDLAYMMSFSRNRSIEKEASEKYQNCAMAEKLTASESIDDCLSVVCENLYLLTSRIKQFAVCLDENWDRFSENDDEYVRSGYSKNAIMKMFYNSGDSGNYNEYFRSAEMFPPRMLEENEPVCCYFTPLHFGDRCFGYIVIKYEADSECAGKIFRLWVKNINTALEYIRVKERLKVINKRMYISSIRDSLTGIYNRQGYKLFSKEMFASAKSEHKKLLVIVADLDRLKYINDNFGHSEGDNAITVTAQAILSCDGNGEKCFRTGGDEYAVIGCGDYDDEMMDFCRKRISGYLGRYNESSGKNYEVETSVGIFLGYVDSYSSIDECYAIADKLMYENKLARKKSRNQTQ